MSPSALLAATAADLAAVDLGALRDDELLAGAIEEEAAFRQLQVARVARLAELEQRGLTDRRYGLCTATYLARECGADPGRLQGELKVGKVLRHLPAIAVAVADGRLSFDHARALARAWNPRVAAGLEALQDTLIELGAQHRFKRWSDELRGIVELLDQDGGHDPNRDARKNHLDVTKTFDGILHLAGTLFGEDAEAALEALNSKADELFRQAVKDHDLTPELEIPPRGTLFAKAWVELCLAGRSVPAGAKRPRPEVTLLINAEDVDEVFDEHGVKLQDGTTRRLRCDADLYPIVVDRLGVPLDMGRLIRFASDAQRRALRLRDGGCVFPGCDRPDDHCEAHHLDHWQFGGTTDLARLAPQCRHHHGVTHRKGWQMFATDDGWFWWQTPAGITFWSQRHGQQRAGPAPPPR